jgi:hypothetical protein
LGNSTAWGCPYLAGFGLATGTKRETETPWGNVFTNLTDADGGESEIEDLVHAGEQDSPNKTDDPSTEG